jgi:hypothetical protein
MKPVDLSASTFSLFGGNCADSFNWRPRKCFWGAQDPKNAECGGYETYLACLGETHPDQKKRSL